MDSIMTGKRTIVVETPTPDSHEPGGETVRYAPSIGLEMHRLVTWVLGHKVVEYWTIEPTEEES